MSRVLSGYIHRATLGLRGGERREVAAELRTHLLDRVRQLEAEGFEREEAEHLAVKAMGNVKVTNSELLGHFFTTPLGWGVLAALILGGGGFLLWRTVPLPLLGQPSVKWEKKLSADDLSFLMSEESAPRATYQVATLSIPAATGWLYLALVPRVGGGGGELIAQPLAASPYAEKTLPNEMLRSRLLLSGKLWEDRVCPPLKGQKQLQVYAALRPLTKTQLPRLQTGGANTCTGITFPDSDKFKGWSESWEPQTAPRQALKLNEWTVLAAYNVEILKSIDGGSRSSGELNHPHDYLFAVMPADHNMLQKSVPEAPRGAPKDFLKYGVGTMLDANDWATHAYGLPRPILQQP